MINASSNIMTSWIYTFPQGPFTSATVNAAGIKLRLEINLEQDIYSGNQFNMLDILLKPI